jgi:hypothetical protein
MEKTQRNVFHICTNWLKCWKGNIVRKGDQSSVYGIDVRK